MAAATKKIDGVGNSGRVGEAIAPAGNADAARYAILRRLAPALKHDMVVDLQAAAMLSEVMGARMERGMPAADSLQQNLTRMTRLTREAVTQCLAVATWIEPQEDEAADLSAGVQECVELLRSNFSFRGFDIANEVAEQGFAVCRSILRNHVVASMMLLTDQLDAPCAVKIASTCTPSEAVLTIRCSPQVRPSDYRPLQMAGSPVRWADVQAMAAEDSARYVRTDGQIVLGLPRMIVNKPLRISPV